MVQFIAKRSIARRNRGTHGSSGKSLLLFHVLWNPVRKAVYELFGNSPGLSLACEICCAETAPLKNIFAADDIDDATAMAEYFPLDFCGDSRCRRSGSHVADSEVPVEVIDHDFGMISRRAGILKTFNEAFPESIEMLIVVVDIGDIRSLPAFALAHDFQATGDRKELNSAV